MRTGAKEHYDPALIREVAHLMRGATSFLEWSRVSAHIIRVCNVSESAATRLVWGLATGYRKPPKGLPAASEQLTFGEEFAVKLYSKNFQNDIENAAAFLGVSVDVYRGHIERLRAQGRPGLIDNA